MQPRRTPIERPPSKIAGIVYVAIGFMALVMATFIMFYRGTLVGPSSNIWKGFSAVMALYGVFRIFSGISMVRKANKMNNSVILNGHDSLPKPPAR